MNKLRLSMDYAYAQVKAINKIFILHMTQFRGERTTLAERAKA